MTGEAGNAKVPWLSSQGFDLLVDLLAVEPIIVLNAAFCEQHRKRCPPSEELLRECAYVRPLVLPHMAKLCRDSEC